MQFNVRGIAGHESGHVVAARYPTGNLINYGFSTQQATGKITAQSLAALAIARIASVFNPAARNRRTSPLGPEVYYMERAANRHALPALRPYMSY